MLKLDEVASKPERARRTRVAALLLAGLCLAGCSAGALSEPETDAQAPTWEEFLALTPQIPGTDVYVTNGDEPVRGLEALRAHYDALYASSTPGVGQSRGALTLNLVADAYNTTYGLWDRWSEGQRYNLTYCVRRTDHDSATRGFGARYDSVVAAMAQAAAAWQDAAGVRYAFVGECVGASPANALFRVEFIQTAETSYPPCGQYENCLWRVGTYPLAPPLYLAAAFFPSWPVNDRVLRIDLSAFEQGAPALVGILRHELGHTLGFRHEHIRGPNVDCGEEGPWIAATTYDNASVMHYPGTQCGGTGVWSLELTDRDKAGASLAYPKDGSLPLVQHSGIAGHVEALDRFNGVSGWAFDQQTPTRSIGVHVYVDGRGFAVTTTNPNPSPDQGYPLPGTHRFAMPIPGEYYDGLPHTVGVYGIDVQGGPVSPLLDNRTFGFTFPGVEASIQWVDEKTVQGWTLDLQSPSTATAVHYYVDGPAGSGAAGFATTANLPRSDDKSGHGFQFTLPSQYQDGRQHLVYVYAIDVQGRHNPLIGGQGLYFLVQPKCSTGVYCECNRQCLTATSCRRICGG